MLYEYTLLSTHIFSYTVHIIVFVDNSCCSSKVSNN